MYKYIIIIYCITSIISCNYTKNETQKESNIPIIDLNKTLEEQKICLQDIANIEYIPLESKEDNVCAGRISYMDDSIIIIPGGNVYKGGYCDVLIFSRSGKFISKFNNQGEGPEEYNFLNDICFDKEKDELYIINNLKKKFHIYNHKGDFIRSINFPIETNTDKHIKIPYYKNYSSDKLLCCVRKTIEFDDGKFEEDLEYILISKKTGEFINKFDIKKEIDKTAHIVEIHNNTTYILNIPTFPIVSTLDGYNIFDTSSDYVYHVDNAMNMKPILKKEYSNNQSKSRIFLMGGIETSKHIFMSKITKKEKTSYQDMSVDDFEIENIVLNKLDNSFNKYYIYNKEWESKKNYLTSQKSISLSNLPNTAIIWNQAHDIKEAYNENKLNGELKAIAEKMNEEDNPVLTLITFK